MDDAQRLFLEAKRLRLKKRFSQNFLVNEAVLEKIAACVDPKSDETLVEIGPGAGFLTEKLLPLAGQLVGVELERNIARYLREKMIEKNKTGENNFKLIEKDILKFDFSEVEAPKFKLVGNLPYNITSPIMFYLFGELDASTHPFRDRITQATFMVQKEVGERITAKAGTKAYNALSIALQYRCEARLEFVVPAKSFYPAPKVDSAVITLTPREKPCVDVKDAGVLSKLVRGAFTYRRKTVRNAILQAGLTSAEILDKMFETAGVDPGKRPEALSIEDFGKLSDAYSKHTG